MSGDCWCSFSTAFVAILKSGPSVIAVRCNCFQNWGGKCSGLYAGVEELFRSIQKLHSSEVGPISFDRALHKALSCSWLVDAVESQSLGCPDRRKLEFSNDAPNGQSGIVTFSAKISLCTSTAVIRFQPAASLNLLNWQLWCRTRQSGARVWGKMTCDAPLSAFHSLVPIFWRKVRNTRLPTSICYHLEVSFSCPWRSNFSGLQKFHRLDILNDRT